MNPSQKQASSKNSMRIAPTPRNSLNKTILEHFNLARSSPPSEDHWGPFFKRIEYKMRSAAREKLRKNGITNEEDMYEVMQDAKLRVIKNATQFKNESSPITWINRIVKNAAVDYKRKNNRFSTTAPYNNTPLAGLGPQNDEMERVLDPKTDVHKQVADRILIEELRTAIARLPEEHKLTLVKYLSGDSYEKIAAELKIAKGTVKSRLNRSHELLREMFPEYNKTN